MLLIKFSRSALLSKDARVRELLRLEWQETGTLLRESWVGVYVCELSDFTSFCSNCSLISQALQQLLIENRVLGKVSKQKCTS